MKNLSIFWKNGAYALLAVTAFAAVPAAPAAAAEIIPGSCDSVTDGDAQGCLFSGNINENPDPTKNHSYKDAEAQYNALKDPNITLNWITASDAGNFGSFGTVFTAPGGLSGTFSLPGWDLEYYAVKAGNQFALYEYLGTNTWVSPNRSGMSHIAFFGTAAAVPEPSTWMLMLLGMAGVGFTMRRKDKQTLRVRYT